MKYTLTIAGTTIRTQQCAKALLNSDLFDITWILTPTAKPAGRKQVITPNPMESFANENNIPIIFVEKKIDQRIRDQVEKLPKPDFLLVVDFGYIIPNWLLEIPKVAPLNIHPSELPRWRGSAPGQFAILFNEKKSAVTLMVMDAKLDHGPIIHQDFFEIDPSWTQTDYYAHAFNLMCDNLDQKIADFAQNPKLIISQPEISPTITAKMIKKEDAFVPWELLTLAMNGQNIDVDNSDLKDRLSALLYSALQSNASLENNSSLALTLERASKAFHPWPGLWTIVPTPQGEKRMKILDAEVTDLENNTTKMKLILKTVHIEGKNPARWLDIKNSIL